MPGNAQSAPAPELNGEVARRIRQIGQRYTTGRQAVVELLAGSDRPLTTAELVGRGERLAQSSVYRNLAVLESAGVVRRILSGGDFTRYELSEELAGHHHHLICNSCGSVADFVVPEPLEQRLDSALVLAAHEAGFSVEAHRLDLLGTCSDCI